MLARFFLALVVTLAALWLPLGADGRSRPAPAAPGAAALPGGPTDEPIAIEQVLRDRDRTVLQVRNRTPFVLIVYIGGVRIGWMRPYRMGLIRGLATGYHRMYAHTRYGTTSWGPRFIYVPGTWNLLY